MNYNDAFPYIVAFCIIGGVGLQFFGESGSSSSSKKKATTGGTYKRRNRQNKSRRK